jgi:hypothetical protein
MEDAEMLKLGQKVKVVENISGHGFEIGEEIKVLYIDSSEDDYVTSFVGVNEKAQRWWLEEREVKQNEVV